MDTSSGRYDVCALLDNRTGVLWEIGGQRSTHLESNIRLAIRSGSQAETSEADFQRAIFASLPQRHGSIIQPERVSHTADASSTVIQLPQVMDDWKADSDTGTTESDGSDMRILPDRLLTESPEPQLGPAATEHLLPIQVRPAATYHDLGTPDDPPRSVAVCPQRKCAAFGCRAGIELHWTDALTGRGLNRWFPLAAASDHLYFLPQSTQNDSLRRLRLISSAKAPPATLVPRSLSLPPKLFRRKGTHDRGRRQSLTRLFFGNLPFPASAVLPQNWQSEAPNDDDHEEDERRGVLRAVDCDHYQAVPISDGDHVLYTDPEIGPLCLGSDAPVGAPTKLNRKVVFLSPHSSDEVLQYTRNPSYTAAAETRWGLRVVAAYQAGSVVLWSVPSDVYLRLKQLRSSTDVWDETSGVLAQSDLAMDNVLATHPNSMTEDEMGNEAALQGPADECLEVPLLWRGWRLLALWEILWMTWLSMRIMGVLECGCSVGVG
ncbi:uncharacterized protein AB675_3379 [Cyphellophora attinorum]|uniref:Uncharacterized protein n=1 Tax=Cyphellophora attinorum TaxID=1664694 RepID=A0A0N0NLZ4_9EURO|nr:uncharacterized protein AB675_3379 [Phialophora attinorum]KPI39609.1 hypothetical protein AB675_3379 [Phialophora attinorum]